VGPRKPKPLDAAGLWSYALRALSTRALTQSEMRTRLAARAELPSDVDEVLQKVKDYGYLDDQRFAETYTRLRLDNQGFGKTRVLRDLRARRVAPVAAEKAVRDAYREVDESALIEQFIRRKLRHSGARPNLKDQRQLASLHRMLLRAGFPSGKIFVALRKLSLPEEWVDGLESTAEEEASD
jgi:regulatory protein